MPHTPAEPDAVRTALETWRRAAAHAARVAPTAVLPDATIDSLVDRRPATTEELADISGIGPGRLRRWGDQLLELLTDAG
jgi:ribonuclease D